ILTPEGGCGLDAVLRQNAYKLSAILHGAYFPRLNPATDPLFAGALRFVHAFGQAILPGRALERTGTGGGAEWPHLRNGHTRGAGKRIRASDADTRSTTDR